MYFLFSVRQVIYTVSFGSFCDGLQFTETETAEGTSCLFSLFYKITFCYYCECTQIEVDPLQF